VRTDTKKSISSPCQVCKEPTSDGKPYCIKHIEQLPQSLAVQSKIEARDEELRVIAARGARAVDLEGVCAREVLAVLAQGPQTVKKLTVALDMPPAVRDALVSALSRAGKIKTIESVVKGKIVKSFSLAGDGLAEAS